MLPPITPREALELTRVNSQVSGDIDGWNFDLAEDGSPLAMYQDGSQFCIAGDLYDPITDNQLSRWEKI